MKREDGADAALSPHKDTDNNAATIHRIVSRSGLLFSVPLVYALDTFSSLVTYLTVFVRKLLKISFKLSYKCIFIMIKINKI